MTCKAHNQELLRDVYPLAPATYLGLLINNVEQVHCGACFRPNKIAIIRVFWIMWPWVAPKRRDPPAHPNIPLGGPEKKAKTHIHRLTTDTQQ